ncbi:MAG: LysM domain-containing protein [Actinomycetota bacterium]|nr:LysM domain-containing protein [Actinomycetota bacterium]
MTLKSGVAYSAIVVGSRGQMVRVVTVVDRGAPLTRSVPRRPATAAVSSHASASSSSVMVKPGDSLWSIARSLVPAGANDAEIEHRLVELWTRNARRIGTNDPNLIFSGQRLLT